MKNALMYFLLIIVCVFVWPKNSFAFTRFSGFVELDYGVKLQSDYTKRDDYNLAEKRLQLSAIHYFSGEHYLAQKNAVLNIKSDFFIDWYFTGKTSAELREASLLLSPFPWMDFKAGRQVFTWGTGDYLFINDQFPKDYVSFYTGRDDEYLKKPSDGIKASFYRPEVNLDFIWIPFFEENTLPTGQRLSFFDHFQGGIAGRNSDRHIVSPPLQLSNSEYALRAYRSLGSNEIAFYGFWGFNKNPESYKNEAARQLYHERRHVYGASLRGPFAAGITSIEIGYDHSPEDSRGKNRLIANSRLQAMTGYTRDLGNDLQVGVQYFFEQMMHYGRYKDSLLPQDSARDEYRHVITNRLTKLFKNQTVTASLFTFYSPSDRDGYVRPSVAYDATDRFRVTLGANIPWGKEDHTVFGQMKRNKNIYIRLRYHF